MPTTADRPKSSRCAQKFSDTSAAPATSDPSLNGVDGPALSPAPASPDANGRDQNGRFAKGNLGGPGNPFARRTAALRQAFADAVSQDGLRILAERLLLQAQNGDVAAAKLVLAYAIGKPVDPVDPDTLDQQELQLFNQFPNAHKDVYRILNSMPVGLACQLVRILLPNTELQIKGIWWKKMQRDEKKEERREKRRAARAAAADGTGRRAAEPQPAVEPTPCPNPPSDPPSPNDPNGTGRRAAERQPAVEPTPCPNPPFDPPSPNAPSGNGRRAPRRQPAVEPTARPNPPSNPPSPNDPNGNGRRAARPKPAVQTMPRPSLPSDPPSPNDPNGERAARRQPAVQTMPRPNLPSDPPSPNDANRKSRRAARPKPALQARRRSKTRRGDGGPVKPPLAASPP